LRPAAAFWARLPPLPLPLLRRLRLLDCPEPELFPPRLDDPGLLEIAAARDLLIPFLRSPSYCLSFLTLEPWSFAIFDLLPALLIATRPSAVPHAAEEIVRLQTVRVARS
jgi:hypothetical protein